MRCLFCRQTSRNQVSEIPVPTYNQTLTMTRPTPFIILTNGRSGSNNLVNLINLHPHALNYGEVLGDWTTAWNRRGLMGFPGDDPASIKGFLNALLSRRSVFYAAQAAALPGRLKGGRPPNLKTYGRVKALGFKDFHLNFERRGVVDYLTETEDLRVIGLRRLDPVRRFVSSSMLGETRQAVAREGETSAFKPLSMSAEEFVEGVNAVHAENQALNATLNGMPSSRRYIIDYETYFGETGQRKQIQREMFEFLGLDPIEAESSHRKMNARPLSQTLENFEAIKAALSGSEFERFLES